MSAAKETLIPSISKLGILAGGGALPQKLIDACADQGINVFIVGFEGQTDARLLSAHDHISVKIGQAGKVINALRHHGITDLVLIGSIKRPSFKEMKPDLKAAKFLMRHGYKALGDSGLLSALRTLLEDEGFQVHGIHHFAPDLLVQAGVIGAYKPSEKDWADIRVGIETALDLGRQDLGQACAVRDGRVLDREDAAGTDAMLKRLEGQGNTGGVLVKLCKPQQDLDLDLPTIGLRTVENAIQAGLVGIVVHAGKSLMVDSEQLKDLADRHKVFVIGVNPDEEK